MTIRHAVEGQAAPMFPISYTEALEQTQIKLQASLWRSLDFDREFSIGHLLWARQMQIA